MAGRSVTSRPSLDVLLDREVDTFDRIVARSREIRGPATFDALEDEANAFCERVRAAFRGAR